MNDIGMQICDDLADALSRCFKLEEAILQVAEIWAISLGDRQWAEEQVRAVAAHPERYNHAPDYWQEIMNSRRETIEKRTRGSGK